MRNLGHIAVAAAVLVTAVFGAAALPSASSAQSVDELQAKIKERNDRIKALEAEIKTYETQISKVGQEANTLQNAIRQLDIAKRKLASELALTETSIGKTELSIQELGNEIQSKEREIRLNTAAIAETIRSINQADDVSAIETLLTKPDLATAWEEIETLEQFQNQIREYVNRLKGAQSELLEKRGETEKRKDELVGLKSTLGDKKSLVEQNQKQKSSLLAQTKSKEAEYKRILQEKAAQRAAFERELFEFESQLKMAIDKTQIAPARKGVLAWPLDNVRITQYFGRTVDAARLYTSGTHNGIDLGAARGTPIKAALTGVVTATGNTDAQPGCYSYGKWVLIKHNNGLSTLYAHLDLVKVAGGQAVATGQVIGYSGATGYATGPHLHFTVYASQGVYVDKYSHSINCKQVTIPIADQKAYLDPMLYL